MVGLARSQRDPDFPASTRLEDWLGRFKPWECLAGG